MSAIDWEGIPLDQFFSKVVRQGDGTFKTEYHPYGKGEAQYAMSHLGSTIEQAYEIVLPAEGIDRWERTGEVPVLRDGEWGYEDSETFTLRDVPVFMDTLVELEKEALRREREEDERRAAERKKLERIRAKERRKLKKLGEWDV